MTRETRHYTVLALIGRGGQGNVYHARMQDVGGFRKEVAIKLLKDGLSEEALQRFRDEARILGLVRDRALVSVDPPIRLAGRWALVMEFADGLSTQWLLSRGGPLPVTVALEIAAEVARVLDKLYRLRGPDGQPLNLLHRDIKPANIQITGEGEVKLLDFGVARADFDERETHTVQHIGGTFGFIAPERLRGVNSPACDVFSLGVTLRVLLTGERPTTMGPATMAAVSPDLFRAVALAEVMRNDDPERRPPAQEVERRARELRASMPGPTLREWAGEVVPELKLTLEDALVGSVLTESFELDPGTTLYPDGPLPLGTPTPSARLDAGRLGLGSPVQGQPRVQSMPRLRPSVARGLLRRALMVLGVAVLVWIMAVGVLGFFFGRWWLGSVGVPLASTDPLLPPIERPIAVSPSPVPADGGKPGGDNLDGGEPGLSRPPAPAGSKPSPSPGPVKPPAPSLAVVDFISVAPAEIWLDGVQIGSTPLYDQLVPVGTHRLRLIAPDKAIETTVLVGGRRGATRFDWDGGSAIGAR